MIQENPFLIEGYISPKYFCDREEETRQLTDHIANGRNVALIAKRRLGKSGLIQNMFFQKEIQEEYNTFYIDIYETKNLGELVMEMGKSILSQLKTRGRKSWEDFLSVLGSLQHSITFNSNGIPTWNVKIGDIKHPDVTLDEIFHYLAESEKPNIVAIDEFQIIADYPEKTVEAALRKRIQNCHNTKFIYSGSHLHMMTQMFLSPSRPFYHSCALMGLQPIDSHKYLCFANDHFAGNAQSISDEAFSYLYSKFDGITWYIQYVLNALYSTASSDMTFEKADIDRAVNEILQRNGFAYSSLLFLLTAKQKQLLSAIAQEDKVTALMSRDFLECYKMSASTVQTAIKVLLDRDIVTRTDDDDNAYIIYDRFFNIWLRRRLAE